MKLFFISDIHGSAYYLKKVLDIFKGQGGDYLIILGDELYHGARNPLTKDYDPKEVAELLNELADRIIAVKGNCDSEVDQMMLKYPIMSEYSTIFYEGKRLFLTHGHIYNEDNMPLLKEGDVLLYGHTHIPMVGKRNGIAIINPGSITLPKSGAPHTYGILEGNTFSILDLDGKIYKEISI